MILLNSYKQQAIQTYLESLTPTEATDYSLWKATKRLQRPQTPIPPLRTSGGEWAKSDIQKVNTLADHFEHVLQPHTYGQAGNDKQDTPHNDKQDTPHNDKQDTPHNDKQDTPHNDKQDTPHNDKQDTSHNDKQDTSHNDKQDTSHTLGTNTLPAIAIKKFTVAEVRVAITKLRSTKAPGYDLITGEILKSYRKSGYRLSHTYTTAFYVLDISLDSGRYPKLSQYSNLVNLQKM